MTKLLRPPISDTIKAAVAVRQLRELRAPEETLLRTERRVGDYLERLLFALQVFMKTNKPLECHHRPALANREKVYASEGRGVPLIHVGYIPDANDPEHLFHLPEDDHDVETRVRGLRGQHSDLGLIRKRKNIEKNRDPNRRKAKIAGAKRWPAKGSQKIRSKGFR